MKTIFKYPIFIKSQHNTLKIPKLAKMLRAGLDANRQLCVWAEVETTNGTTELWVSIYPTGGEMLPPTGMTGPGTHLDSVDDGPFIWHVYFQPTHAGYVI